MTEFTELPDALRSVRTRPLFVMRLEVAGVQRFGQTPGGTRRVIPVPGGSFKGERLSGVVLEGGSDWQQVRDDAVTLDVRLTLKTDDGAMLGMSYRGIRHGSPQLLAKLDRGEQVSPEEYYFRTAPVFETAAPQYEWLNRIVAIGIGDRRADGPIYSIFEVL
jgi:hypothetical protein